MDDLVHALRDVVQKTAFVCDDCDMTAHWYCEHEMCKRLVSGRPMLLCRDCVCSHEKRRSTSLHQVKPLDAAV